MNTALTELVADLTNRIAAGVAPWRKTWQSGGAGTPLRSDGVPFTGANAMLLSIARDARGYTSAHWFTFKQALALDACVRKGEKGAPALLYKPMRSANDNDDGDGDGGAPASRGRAYLAAYTVFSADQIEGLDPAYYAPPPLPKWSEAALPPTLRDYPVDIAYGAFEPAYYDAIDTIRMPHPSAFDSFADYCATLAHEQIHSTGHASRLDRQCLADYHKDLRARAEEELIAELGSYFLSMRCGVPYSEALIDGHASYLASWAKRLREQPNALFTAAAAAQRAVDYLIQQAEAAALPLAA